MDLCTGILNIVVSAKELSWGRIFNFDQQVDTPYWIDELSGLMRNRKEETILPTGFGRSYGDSCLNKQGTLIKMTGLNRLIRFDDEKGILHCEAGVSLEEILKFSIPKGWFLPVTPGTMHVSIGGAIANDVHGKNHHRAGSFGCHVHRIYLMRTDSSIVECSAQENHEIFGATIGGLGLTGIITSAEIQLKKITSEKIYQQVVKFSNIDEFFIIEEESSENYEYTVSWVDSMATGTNLGRGLYIRGNHLDKVTYLPKKISTKAKISIPTEIPSFMLNKFTISKFNNIYFGKQKNQISTSNVSFKDFFYPLDGIRNWNKLYGRNGFRQFQFVLDTDRKEALIKILEIVANSKMSSFLTVLKKFGDIQSPGIMSFPKKGYTIAFDFPNNGTKTLSVIDKLTEIVINNHGRIYPAKDSTMDPQTFHSCYQRIKEFESFIDPGISSDFWRRINRIAKS
ncbi:MAG: FAD-binding oxidoreductase [Bdellovibrionota bacterium]